MAERIGQHGDPSVGRVLGRGLELGAGRDSALDGGVDVVDDDVGMDGRPVPAVAPGVTAGADRAGILGQEIDRRRPAHDSTKPLPKRRATLRSNAAV